MSTIQTITLITAIAGAICGLLGAVLGIINTCHQLRRDKVRLRVVPKIVNIINGGELSAPKLCIEVTNLSVFSVTITNVGFEAKEHDLCLFPILYDGKPWPRRLESRQSIMTFFGDDWETNRELCSISCAFASTECGETRFGSIKRIKKRIRKIGRTNA